ncbi:protein-export chaperone SecB [Amaricoccus sp.]|uniref:protein-export chaperone SecB n=1 Tax=Amaricoccus sp. TaxID=1872485 RepID=UPI001B73F4CD|nr:protein-export chaperone SecB [Amaricoccus sp.]MBP7002413.1 protein-export chaperone SecB [Amaricoccus sp.]
MAEHENGAAAPEQPQPRLQIINQFIRDLSFENVAVQKGAPTDGKPEVKVTINLDAANRGSDQYDVALKLKVDSHVSGTPLFILELDYAGRFLIQGVPQEQLHPLLMIECPRLIFPFLRRIVSDVTRDGGYPPLNLEMIDFMTLYRQELARRQAEAPKTANA